MYARAEVLWDRMLLFEACTLKNARKFSQKKRYPGFPVPFEVKTADEDKKVEPARTQVMESHKDGPGCAAELNDKRQIAGRAVREAGDRVRPEQEECMLSLIFANNLASSALAWLIGFAFKFICQPSYTALATWPLISPKVGEFQRNVPSCHPA